MVKFTHNFYLGIDARESADFRAFFFACEVRGLVDADDTLDLIGTDRVIES